MSDFEYDIIIAGAGAAGLMAACESASMGKKVLLLEKMDRPGKKLMITGKGRCNITNSAPVEDFIEHFGRNGRFLRQAFGRFFTDDVSSFFESEGVPLVVERGGRMFPASGTAEDIVKALVKKAQRHGAAIERAKKVQSIILNAGRVEGVKVSTLPSKMGPRLNGLPEESACLRTGSLILATGGQSYSATGSSGDGYRLAKETGHSIIQPRPALVPLVTKGPVASKLQGLSLRNVSVTLIVEGKKRAHKLGEMLFAHFGLTGPVILSLSGKAVDALAEGRSVTISIDLKPGLDEKKLDARILRDIDEHGKQQFKTVLKGLLPRKLIPVCIAENKIAPDIAANQITAAQRKGLRLWLKDFRFEIKGHRPFSEAIITAGGIDTREVNPRTMESRRVKGLYFAGEVLDIAADTGGYNLQAAFSTGWLAGHEASLAKGAF